MFLYESHEFGKMLKHGILPNPPDEFLAKTCKQDDAGQEVGGHEASTNLEASTLTPGRGTE